MKDKPLYSKHLFSNIPALREKQIVKEMLVWKAYLFEF